MLLVALTGRFIIVTSRKAFGQILFVDVMSVVGMRITVPFAKSHLFHHGVGGLNKLTGYFKRRKSKYILPCFSVRSDDGIGFGCRRQVAAQ